MSFRPFRPLRWLARFAASRVASFTVPFTVRRRRQEDLRQAPAPLRGRLAAADETEAIAAEHVAAESVAPQVVVAADSAAQRRRRLTELTRLAGSVGADRCRAMQEAGRWGHPAVLPLLRRGLRDADPAVMAAAARAMERFRGKPRRPLASQASPLPRRVARTR